nr:MAG TPA: hypothetical protein [Caudoviricetes sp.]
MRLKNKKQFSPSGLFCFNSGGHKSASKNKVRNYNSKKERIFPGFDSPDCFYPNDREILKIWRFFHGRKKIYFAFCKRK